MKYCDRCGTGLEDEARFCPCCGKAVWAKKDGLDVPRSEPGFTLVGSIPVGSSPIPTEPGFVPAGSAPIPTGFDPASVPGARYAPPSPLVEPTKTQAAKTKKWLPYAIIGGISTAVLLVIGVAIFIIVSLSAARGDTGGAVDREPLQDAGEALQDASAIPIAAMVNGVEILEADVTIRIESFRLDPSTDKPLDDVAWAQLLQGSGYTPETLREFVIRNQFAVYVLILQKAADAGITPSSAEVNRLLADAKESVENSGSTWEDYLVSRGYSSEDIYRQELEGHNVIQALADSQITDATLTEKERDTARMEYLTGLIESDEIVIYPMPGGLSYAVDMSLAATGASSNGQPGGSGDSSAGRDQLGITDTVEGTGPAVQSGDTVLVLYVGYLEDGTVFDSSTEQGTPFEATIGQGDLIQGWELGLIGMKAGGKRQLVIPPELAYGKDGSWNIPSNATLIFDIELLSINNANTIGT